VMKTLELRSISRFVTLSLNDPLFSNAPGPTGKLDVCFTNSLPVITAVKNL